MGSSAPFDSTPQFQNFRERMRKVIAVPKATIDALVQAARESSPRKGKPNAAGRKRNPRPQKRNT
jgi:hypothetical protein